jgi:transposase-like protein
VNEQVITIAQPPVVYDADDGKSCPKCEGDITKTNGQRQGKTLFFCENCGRAFWWDDAETERQREREQFWLKQRYGAGFAFVRSISDYWRKGGAL